MPMLYRYVEINVYKWPYLKKGMRLEKHWRWEGKKDPIVERTNG